MKVKRKPKKVEMPKSYGERLPNEFICSEKTKLVIHDFKGSLIFPLHI